jgi:hypothetical protein
MNVASILVTAAIVLLLVLAVRYIKRNGPCAVCPDVKKCSGTTSSCGSGCAGCSISDDCHQGK